MVEYFQLLLTLGALLVVLLGIWALVVRFIAGPILALVAIPTYAAMVALEYFINQHNGGKCPRLLKFSRPGSYWKKLCMDFFAAYCTVIGMQIAIIMFKGVTSNRPTENGINRLIMHSGDKNQFILIAIFWMFFVATYLVSAFHNDDPEHPVNKLEDLVIPEWVKQIITKTRG